MKLRFSGPQNEHEFLPAALEVQETPPSPIGRAIIWVIVLFALLATIWATFGKVDIIVVSPGKIIASGHTKVIQPLEIGVVRKIRVQEGQAVKRGDILIELEPEKSMADWQRIEDELKALEHGIHRLNSLLGWLSLVGDDEQVLVSDKLPEGISVLQQQLLLSQWYEFRSRVAALKYKQNKLHSERNGIDEQVKKYQAILPIITKRTLNTSKLKDEGIVSEEEYLQNEQQRLEMVHDLRSSQQRSLELQAAMREVSSQVEQVKKEFKSRTLIDLQEFETRRQAFEQEKIKASAHLSAQVLEAPVSGVVQQLVVHTEGGVVTPAQQLMVVVPVGAGLEVEAMVANKDIGFIQEGQNAEVKIDAFPFTKYGLIDAMVTNLSNDAVADEELGLVYKAHVKLATSTVQVEGKQVDLSPGMSVAVEIKTGKRRLIEYFLSPLLRYKQESVRER